MKTLFPSAVCFMPLTESTPFLFLIPPVAKDSMERCVSLCPRCPSWQSSLHPYAPHFALEWDVVSSLLLILLWNNKSWQNHTGEQLGGVMSELQQRGLTVIHCQTSSPFLWDSPWCENGKRIWRHTQLVKPSPLRRGLVTKHAYNFSHVSVVWGVQCTYFI